MSVSNQGIGGNRILRDGLGPNILARFDRDVITIPRVRWLIVLACNQRSRHGSRGARGWAARRDGRGSDRRVSTDDPARTRPWHLAVRRDDLAVRGFSYFSPEGEADRQAINHWMRTSGELDQVIDFDAVARDPSAPTRLSAAVDGGGHLHPSAMGSRILADSSDLRLFE